MWISRNEYRLIEEIIYNQEETLDRLYRNQDELLNENFKLLKDKVNLENENKNLKRKIQEFINQHE